MTAEFACGGKLSCQHSHVRSCDAIGISIERVPRASNCVIDCNVSTRSARAGVEVGEPRVVPGLNGADASFSTSRVGNSFKSNGDPAVVGKVRVNREEQAVDAVGCACTQSRLVKVRGGVDQGCIRGVPGNRRQKVIRIHVADVKSGGAVSC